MKFKYYLRGFGVGVIFATVVLMFAFALHDNKPTGVVNSSGNAIKKENITTTKSKEEISKDTTEAVKETTSEIETTLENITPETTITTSEISTPEVSTEETSMPETPEIVEETTPDTTVVNTPASTGETVTLVITSGMTSNRASDILQELGVVESGYDLNMFLYNNGYESKLRVGSFEIPKGASYQEIADIITRK